MKRTLVLLLIILLACSETAERDESTTGVYIVSIAPPILDEGRPAEQKINVGELTEAGWQPITITFSQTPEDLSVEKPHALVSQWTLKGRVLTIRTFCDYR